MHRIDAGCNTLFPSGLPQPLLDHDEAEQELVVILPARSVVIQKVSNSLRLKQIIHERAFVQEQF